jgi:hypothetical protein
MAGTAGEALTAAAVETIARGGGLVAGRAGGHRPTLPSAPHDFADSPFRLLRVAKEPDRLLVRYVLYATWLLRLATATLIRRLA